MTVEQTGRLQKLYQTQALQIQEDKKGEENQDKTKVDEEMKVDSEEG